jgi:hypothetical protein
VTEYIGVSGDCTGFRFEEPHSGNPHRAWTAGCYRGFRGSISTTWKFFKIDHSHRQVSIRLTRINNFQRLKRPIKTVPCISQLTCRYRYDCWSIRLLESAHRPESVGGRHYRLSPPAMRLTPPAMSSRPPDRYSYPLSSRASPYVAEADYPYVYAPFLGVFFCLEKRGDATDSLS